MSGAFEVEACHGTSDIVIDHAACESVSCCVIDV